MIRRSYCTRCDDYGHDAYAHEEFLSNSVVRRLQIVKGDNWWVDENAKPNGIGPICFFCGRLIDWPPTDHSEVCPVRKYINLDEPKIQWNKEDEIK